MSYPLRLPKFPESDAFSPVRNLRFRRRLLASPLWVAQPRHSVDSRLESTGNSGDSALSPRQPLRFRAGRLRPLGEQMRRVDFTVRSRFADSYEKQADCGNVRSETNPASRLERSIR